MTNRNPNQPRHNRCDACGRRAHKVVVRRLDLNLVLGLCPTCWERDTVGRPAHWGPFNWDNVQVLRDFRATKPAGTTPPAA